MALSIAAHMATKVGLIGAGVMLQYHATCFKLVGAEIIAIVDSALGAAQKTSMKWGILHAYKSMDAMLPAHKELNAFSAIVPNKFHPLLAIRCLNSGKHVFCVKPPALIAPEVFEIITTSKKAGKHVMFNFNNRARPKSQVVIKYISQGKVGKINSSQAKWICCTGIPGYGGWFTTKEAEVWDVQVGRL